MINVIKTSILPAVLFIATSCADRETAIPPIAKKTPYDVTLHDDPRTDDYYWLRDDSRSKPEVLDYLRAENAYLDSVMRHTQDRQAKLVQELKSRITREDTSQPYDWNGYWYSRKYLGENEFPILIRQRNLQPGAIPEQPQAILDANLLAQGKPFFLMGGSAISENNQYLAYATDSLGRRIYTIEVLDMVTGLKLSDRLEGVNPDMVWGNDHQTLYYVLKDVETLLGNQVYRHHLGTPQSDDVLIYEETDNNFYIGLGKTRDASLITIAHEHSTQTGLSFMDANNPDGDLKTFYPSEDSHKYQVQRSGGDFYIRTNWRSSNFRIMKVVAGEESNRHQWQEVLPHRKDVLIEDFLLLDDVLVTKEIRQGLTQFAVHELENMSRIQLEFDDPIYSASFSYNPRVRKDRFRIEYSSLTKPVSIIEIDTTTGQQVLLKQQQIEGGYSAGNYQSERISVTARDGVAIPVSLVYRKDLFKKDGTNPVYQYGYGAYGLNIEPEFWVDGLSLLDRGFVYAIAHIRGGGMLGQSWYDEGRLLNKMNSFTDFIDVTRGLVEAGYGHKDKIFAAGASAGGLLMAGVANMAGSEYLGIIAGVPFVDAITTMNDPSIPLVTNEYDEWGNPAIFEQYQVIKSYSPYDNVKAMDYPNMLITTALHDSQVQYYEPAKWVAKLRALKTDNNLLLLHVNMEAGHGGAAGRFKRVEETGLKFTFLLEALERQKHQVPAHGRK
jgi:oligopeptidase B